jgi:hypothetical protein
MTGKTVANGARRPRAAQLEPEEGEAMQVLEVRNAELTESITQQAAEQGITDAAIVAPIGAADSFTDPLVLAGPLPDHAPPWTPASRWIRLRVASTPGAL